MHSPCLDLRVRTAHDWIRVLVINTITAMLLHLVHLLAVQILVVTFRVPIQRIMLVSLSLLLHDEAFTLKYDVAIA